MKLTEHTIVAAIADLLSTVRCATTYAATVGSAEACGACPECQAERLARAIADGDWTDEDFDLARGIIYGDRGVA